ncbi:BUD3 [Candida oxycetoniae]|uniref:BUD3 n=1 Tax=Candida oxycetoniae TaxID=497107 RepID=A0AAI9SXW1_9ASCO|nr:BUD3 [Candida oxycetoniae]KAI3405099.2 BUD3 [Candida oxycetoniae]
MSVYRRYASGEHDKEFFQRDELGAERFVGMVIPHLSGQFDKKIDATTKQIPLEQWMDIFHQAAIFVGYDDILFGTVITIVYKNPQTEKISTQCITKYGLSTYLDMKLNPSSRFWPSCENLLVKYQKSLVRRALAISNLKNCNKLFNFHQQMGKLPMWDETNAGNLANNMKLICNQTPETMGRKLLDLGLLQDHFVKSLVFDVVYKNNSNNNNNNTEYDDDNNRLVSLLGEQLDQLFDPLLEYSPESVQTMYKPSPSKLRQAPSLGNSQKIRAVVDELVAVQTKFTIELADLLQNLIIPIRVSVLDKNTTSTKNTIGISKLNRIFPPTIDEITRINCILNDALLKAYQISYVEIFIAIGTIVPYFYKPFIRHEANVRKFYPTLMKFSQNNKKSIFDNPVINSSGYSVRKIDSIVTGSLLELPKLKMILHRLYEQIQSESIKAKNFETLMETNEELSIIEKHFHSAMQVFEAFGETTSDTFNEQDLKQRFFTPTGKVLTELATHWPAELQYGWLTRKVIGIFELIDIKVTSPRQKEILIVFSDCLLFLKDTGGNNNSKQNDDDDDDDGIPLSIPDVLMHSLINEKPLPNFDSFPSMEVSYWCNIEDVIVSAYSTLDASNIQRECIRFLNHSSAKLESKDFTKNYQLYNNSPHQIIDLINRAKILKKTASFHLFKENDEEVNIYYTVHDIESHNEETYQSPFVLFLNMEIDDVPQYFETHPNVYLLLQIVFIDDRDTLQVTGYNKCGKEHINELVPALRLTGYLRAQVARTYHHIFQTFNQITECLINSNEMALNYIGNQAIAAPIRIEAKKANTSINKNEILLSSSSSSSPPSPPPHGDLQKTNKHELKGYDLKRKKSLINKLFKKKHEPPAPPPTTKSKADQKNLPNTFIPRGMKTEYKGVIMPLPILKQRADSSSSSVVDCSLETTKTKTKTNTKTSTNTNTNSQTHKQLPLIEVPPNLQLLYRNDLLQDMASLSTVDPTLGPACTIKRVSTFDDVAIILKQRSQSFQLYCIDEDISDEEPNWELTNIESSICLNKKAGKFPQVSSQQVDDKDDVVAYTANIPSKLPVKLNLSSLSSSLSSSSSTKRLFISRRSLGKQRKSSNQTSIFSTVPTTPITTNTFPIPLHKSTEIAFLRSPMTEKQIWPKPRLARDMSFESLTPSQYASDLGKLIDLKFSDNNTNDDDDDDDDDERILTQELSRLTPLGVNKNSSILTLTNGSSESHSFSDADDMFYSPEEQFGGGGGCSDDATLYDDVVKTGAIDQVMRDESIAQLSQLLNQTVNFGEFQVDTFAS